MHTHKSTRTHTPAMLRTVFMRKRNTVEQRTPTPGLQTEAHLSFASCLSHIPHSPCAVFCETAPIPKRVGTATVKQQFSTGMPQEFLKHAIPDYLVRSIDLFALRLSDKKMTTANTTIAIQCARITEYPHVKE